MQSEGARRGRPTPRHHRLHAPQAAGRAARRALPAAVALALVAAAAARDNAAEPVHSAAARPARGMDHPRVQAGRWLRGCGPSSGAWLKLVGSATTSKCIGERWVWVPSFFFFFFFFEGASAFGGWVDRERTNLLQLHIISVRTLFEILTTN